MHSCTTQKPRTSSGQWGIVILLPCPVIILHTVGSSDHPARADDGRSAHMAIAFDVEADLPGELALLCVLAAHDTRRLEHAPPTVCTGDNHSGLLELVVPLKCMQVFLYSFWCNKKVWAGTTCGLKWKTNKGAACNVPHLASSDPSSQSGVPSHSGFTLFMQFPFLHRYVRSVQVMPVTAVEEGKKKKIMWKKFCKNTSLSQ